MSSNKTAKMKLIERYGEIDFLDRLKIKVPKSKKYTSKGQLKRMKKLTYHHILERSEGGRATVENGALLTAEHHAWFHRQPEPVQQKLNAAFQTLKEQIDSKQEVKITMVDDEELNIPFDFNVAEIAIEENGKLKVYNRAKMKRKVQKMVQAYEESLEERE